MAEQDFIHELELRAQARLLGGIDGAGELEFGDIRLLTQDFMRRSLTLGEYRAYIKSFGGLLRYLDGLAEIERLGAQATQG